LSTRGMDKRKWLGNGLLLFYTTTELYLPR
jgi:hypothetical protein